MLSICAALQSFRLPSAIQAFLHRFAVISLVIILPPLAAVVAQQNTDDTIRVNTDLLLFPVRVRDKHGMAPSGLREKDLVLKDEDHATTALYFSPGADRVALLFALDQSGSLREVISQQRDAALGLLERFGPSSSVAVLTFAETTSLTTPFNRDIDTARSAFHFVASANSHTAIFDAAANAVKAFDQLPPARIERHIVILISDGLDNASHVKAGSVIAAAVAKNVSFYVIHLPLLEPRDGHLAVRRASSGFRDLAEKTGGKYFIVGNSKNLLGTQATDLTPIFRAIEEDLKSQYLLGFYIADSVRDGRKRVFSLGLLPEGLEYAVGRFGYSRVHKFSVNPRAALQK